MSQPRSIDRLAVSLASIVGVLASLIALGEKLGTFSTSKAFAYLYLAKDLFAVEIVLLLLLVLCRNAIFELMRRAAAAVPVIWKQGSREQTALLLTAVGLLMAMMLGAYHAYYYVAGKRYALDAYPGWLADRASREFLGGDMGDARFVAKICTAAYENATPCQRILISLDRRERWSHLIRKIFDETYPNTRWRSAMALAIYLQDRDWAAYDHRLNLQENRRAKLDVLYRDGLNKAISGDLDGAISALGAAGGGFNYGRADDLVRELDGVKAGKPPAAMLLALKKYGSGRFAQEVTASFLPLRLTAPVREGESANHDFIGPTTELQRLIADLDRGWQEGAADSHPSIGTHE